MIEIYWKTGDAEGSSDLLPASLFERDGSDPHITHTIRGRDRRLYDASCALSVEGRIVCLDYGGDNADANYSNSNTVFHPNDFPVGVMRLTFSDESRAFLEQVEWRLEHDADFEEMIPDDAEVLHCPKTLAEVTSFDPQSVEDGRRRIEQFVVIRQGQAAFRRRLLQAYGGKCAITGCEIEDILEAAHISPYKGTQTDDVTNGLLLRADIHTLFDRGLIKVDRNYLVTAAPAVVEAYDLPKTIRLPSDRKAHPHPEALALKFNLGTDLEGTA
ncbi:MAG: HNH endonuclease [Novosphingobium sp.]